MKNNKISRLNHTLVREISYILETEIKNKNIKFVTVTEVRVTNDLSFAKVFVTVLNDETLKALNKAKGFIRTQLCDKVDIRHMPELEFIYDESMEYGNRIEEELKKIHEEK